MPHVRLLSTPSQYVRVAYFNDATVGRGCVNHRKDVLLVQFLLRSLADKVDSVWKETFSSARAGEPEISIDGVCGPETIGSIERFQALMSDVRPPQTDGRVDVAPFGKNLIGKTNKAYTIVLLNVNFGFYYGPDRHAAIFKEPSFPAELKDVFFT